MERSALCFFISPSWRGSERVADVEVIHVLVMKMFLDLDVVLGNLVFDVRGRFESVVVSEGFET